MTKSTLNSALNFLKNTRIFKDADEKLLTNVLNTYGKSVSYSKNDTVFSKETYSPVICIIIKGEARVSKGETVISHLKDGEIFGAAFLYNQSYEFENTVTALTPLKVVIIEKSGEQTDNEGCLSLPGKFSEVTRPMKVTVRAQDRYGNNFTVTGEGLKARALCHEIDHLDGILYIDRANKGK